MHFYKIVSLRGPSASFLTDEQWHNVNVLAAQVVGIVGQNLVRNAVLSHKRNMPNFVQTMTLYSLMETADSIFSSGEKAYPITVRASLSVKEALGSFFQNEDLLPLTSQEKSLQAMKGQPEIPFIRDMLTLVMLTHLAHVFKAIATTAPHQFQFLGSVVLASILVPLLANTVIDLSFANRSPIKPWVKAGITALSGALPVVEKQPTSIGIHYPGRSFSSTFWHRNGDQTDIEGPRITIRSNTVWECGVVTGPKCVLPVQLPISHERTIDINSQTESYTARASGLENKPVIISFSSQSGIEYLPVTVPLQDHLTSLLPENSTCTTQKFLLWGKWIAPFNFLSGQQQSLLVPSAAH